MIQITFVEADGQQHAVAAESGQTLMEVAVGNGVPGIEAECGGGCACATCHVMLEEGGRSKFPDAEPLEVEMLKFAAEPGDNSRLSCQLNLSEIHDGLVVYLPESQY